MNYANFEREHKDILLQFYFYSFAMLYKLCLQLGYVWLNFKQEKCIDG